MVDENRDNDQVVSKTTGWSTRRLKVDEEFSKIPPSLSEQEFEALRDDIIARGCIMSIVVWNGIIIDGNNRYGICQTYNIPFRTKEINFLNRTEARDWIVKSQLARRNLGIFAKYELLTKRSDILQSMELARANRMSNLKGQAQGTGSESPKFGNSRLNSQELLAKELGCSKGTISQMDFIERKVNEGKVHPDTLSKLRSGEVSINSVYASLKASEESVVSGSEEKKSHLTEIENAINKVLNKAKSVRLVDLLELEPKTRRKLVIAIRDAQRNLSITGTGLENLDKHPKEVRKLAEGQMNFDMFLEVLGMRKLKSQANGRRDFGQYDHDVRDANDGENDQEGKSGGDIRL